MPCPCNSGKKFKHCHGAPHNLPVAKSRLEQLIDKHLGKQVPGAAIVPVEDETKAPDTKQQTALAMLRAGVRKQIIWSYLETGLFITEVNRAAHSEEDLAKWDQALADYEKLPPEQQDILIVVKGSGDTDEPLSEADVAELAQGDKPVEPQIVEVGLDFPGRE